MKKNRCTKQELYNDLRKISKKAYEKDYFLTHDDVFALGYMAGKYDIKRLLDNQEEVIEACRKYDEMDDLGLFDTVGETLIDLEIIKNDGRI